MLSIKNKSTNVTVFYSEDKWTMVPTQQQNSELKTNSNYMIEIIEK